MKRGLPRRKPAKRDYIGRGRTSQCAGTCLSGLPISTSPVPYPLLFLNSTSPKVDLNVKDRTETLEIGVRAPDFSLGAANREGTFTLGGLLAQGTVVLEFLRGTW